MEYKDEKVFNPWNTRNIEIRPTNIVHILAQYGWKGRIRNLELFKRACCHKSYVDHPELYIENPDIVSIVEKPDECMSLQKCDNEELEFLGDRVIGLIISDYMTKRYTKEGEGFMTRIFSRITNNNQLGKIAKQIGLSKWVILSRHMEEICDGRNNLRILGSLFEAWIGALYLQEEDVGRGFKACNDYLIQIIEKHVDFVQLITEDTNYKDQLLRLFQSVYHVPPKYKEISTVGPLHDRTFTMGVIDPSGNVIAYSSARNKKVAEQDASRLALDILYNTVDTNIDV